MASVSHSRKMEHVGELLDVDALCKETLRKPQQNSNGENADVQGGQSVHRRHINTLSTRIKGLDISRNSPRRIAVLRANSPSSSSVSGNVSQPKNYRKIKVPFQSPINRTPKAPANPGRSPSSSYQKGARNAPIKHHQANRTASDKYQDIPRAQKALPPTPVLLGQDFREHRGTYNTTNSTSIALTKRLPLSRPASPRRPSSSITGPPGSFKNTSSSLSASGCPPTSLGNTEYGITKAAGTQPFSKARVEIDLKHSHSTKTTFIRERPNKGSCQSISAMPSTNRRCSNAQAVAGKLQKRPNSYRQGGSPSTAPHPTQCEEILSRSDPSASNGEGASFERSATYGYCIRESLEAHQVIMGEAIARERKSELATTRGNSKSDEETCNDVYSNAPPDLDISNTVPMNRRIRKQAELNKERLDRQGAREVYRTVGFKPQGQISHPGRSSSLPIALSNNPSSTYVNIHPSCGISVGETIPAGRERHASGAELTSQAGRGDRTSRASLLYRQTVSSAARTSTRCERGVLAAPPNISTSRSRRQSGRNSLGNVGKGMKKLGEKVSKIISSRRVRGTAGKESRSLEANILTSELQRPSSPLQTAVRGGGVDNSTGINIQFSPSDKQMEHRAVGAQPSASSIPGEAIGSPGIQIHSTEEILAQEADIQHEGADSEQGTPGMVVRSPGVQSDDQSSIHQSSDVASNLLGRPQGQGPRAGNSISADNTAEKTQDATNNLLRFVDAHVLQWVLHTREMEESPLRNYLIEAATQTADGLIMAREVRMASLRLDQIVHGLAGRLADNAVAIAMAFDIYPRQ